MTSSNSEDSLQDFQPRAMVDGEKIPDVTQFNIYNTLASSIGLEDKIPKTPGWREYSRVFRPDWLFDHRDYASLKVILPTFFQIWVTVIFCVIPKTSHWIGNAAYLLQIIGFICSSGGLLISINVILSFVCFAYCVAAWLFAVVALAITSKIRGWPSVESIAQLLIEEGACTVENVDECMIDEFYTGRFLETRCSVIFAIALVFGTVFLGFSEGIHPLGRLVFVCGMIVLIINICYTVFFPVFLPKIVGISILKPMGLAFAMKILASILVFPFTSNFKYFQGETEVLATLRATCDKNSSFFRSMKPTLDSFAHYKELPTDIQKIRLRLPLLDVFLQSCRLECSFGRFDAGDAAEFRSKIKPLMNTIAGYEYFYLLFQERKEVASNMFMNFPRRHSLSSAIASSSNKLVAAFAHTYRKVAVFEAAKRTAMLKEKFGEDPEERITLADLDIISEHISERYSPYLDAISTAIGANVEWLRAANEFRTYSICNWSRHVEEQEKCHNELVSAKAEFEHAFQVLEQTEASHKNVAEEIEGDEQALCLVSQTALFLFLSKEVGKQVMSLTNFLLSIDEKRPTPKLFSFLTKTKHDKSFNTDLLQEDPSKQGTDILQEVTQRRDPDALDPTTTMQSILVSLFRVYHLLGNEQLWFWIKVGIFINACSLPFYCRTTAHWYYSSRLIWLPIMCGVSTAEYSAESVYLYIVKMVYSFFGVLSGLIAWYISTGLGNGNYYGYAVVTAILYFVLCYYRQFAIHLNKVPGIMVSVTPTLVLGISWVDAKYNKLVNIGMGWRVALTRFVSVVIGLSVAFLASTFPKAKSSKAAVRKALANALEQSCGLHCQVSSFAIQRLQDPNVHIHARHDKTTDEIRTLLLSLANIRAMMKPIQYEVPFTGRWPQENYERLNLLVNDVIQLYYLMYRMFNQVEDTETWIPHMINRAGWANSELSADMLSLVHMASGSLRDKTEMPKITNATTSVKHLETVRLQWGRDKVSLSERFYNEPEEIDESENNDEKSNLTNMRQRGAQSINFSKLLSHDGQLNVVCLLLMHMIYKRIDEAVIVVKGLVGEKYDVNDMLFQL